MFYKRLKNRYFFALVLGVLFFSALLLAGLVKFIDSFENWQSRCGCAAASVNPWIVGIGSLISLFLMIGLTAAFVKIIKLILSSRKIAKQVISAQQEIKGDIENLFYESGIEKKAILFENKLPYAFCFGIIKPRIAISTGLLKELTNEELKAVLLHEKTHLESGESLKVLIGEFLSSFLFFLPIFRKIFNSYRTVSELEADEAANRLSLGMAISKLAKSLNYKGVSIPSLSFAAQINERLKRLTCQDYKFKAGFGFRYLITPVLFIFAAVVIIFGSPEPIKAHRQCSVQPFCHKQQESKVYWSNQEYQMPECRNSVQNYQAKYLTCSH